jgi:hypothetical protein
MRRAWLHRHPRARGAQSGAARGCPHPPPRRTAADGLARHALTPCAQRRTPCPTRGHPACTTADAVPDTPVRMRTARRVGESARRCAPERARRTTALRQRGRVRCRTSASIATATTMAAA